MEAPFPVAPQVNILSDRALVIGPTHQFIGRHVGDAVTTFRASIYLDHSKQRISYRKRAKIRSDHATNRKRA
jgi:hypothetical protein